MKTINGPIKGYKIFNTDFTNMYGMKFEFDKKYHIDGKIEFGPLGNGFHFCDNFEDPFRFFDTTKEFIYTQVEGSGKVLTYDDEYYGYYDMHVSSDIKILKKMSRKEIIELAKHINYFYGENRIRKFISTFYLSDEEFDELLNSYKNENIKKIMILNRKKVY